MWKLGDMTMACSAKLQCEGVKYVFQKSSSHLKITGARTVTRTKRYTGNTKISALPHKLQSPRWPGARDLCTSVVVQNSFGKIGCSPSPKIHLEALLGMLMLPVAMAVDLVTVHINLLVFQFFSFGQNFYPHIKYFEPHIPVKTTVGKMALGERLLYSWVLWISS